MHTSPIVRHPIGHPEAQLSPSPPLGAERVGVRWGKPQPPIGGATHLTLPRLRRGPLPLPPRAERGKKTNHVIGNLIHEVSNSRLSAARASSAVTVAEFDVIAYYHRGLVVG